MWSDSLADPTGTTASILAVGVQWAPTGRIGGKVAQLCGYLSIGARDLSGTASRTTDRALADHVHRTAAARISDIVAELVGQLAIWATNIADLTGATAAPSRCALADIVQWATCAWVGAVVAQSRGGLSIGTNNPSGAWAAATTLANHVRGTASRGVDSEVAQGACPLPIGARDCGCDRGWTAKPIGADKRCRTVTCGAPGGCDESIGASH